MNPSNTTDLYYGHPRTEVLPLLPAFMGDVLEVGCGSGATMEWIKSVRKVSFAAGIELFPTAGEAARKHFDYLEIASIDASDLHFPVERFDTIIALDVLEHLVNPAITIGRLKAKLKPNGHFLISLPNVANYSVSWPLFFLGKWEYTDEGHLDTTHLRFFVKKTAIQLLTSAGFEITSISSTYKAPNIFQIFGLTSAKWRWYSLRILKALPFASHWIESQYLILGKKTAA